MRKLDKWIIASLLCSSLAAASAFADMQTMDRDQPFRRGWGGNRGNERSERPGRFAPGQLNYGGNGCPEGTMRVVFAPDNLSFSILFDKFVADTSASDGGQRGVMSCDATLPIQIPAGQQMEITRVDFRGFVGLPAGSRAMLHSMFNFVGEDFGGPGRGPRWGGGMGRGRWRDRDRINIKYLFEGPVAQNYEISTGSMNEGRGLTQTEVSPCGGEAQLRIRNTVQVMSRTGEQASVTIDSIDGSSNAVYYVNWRSCQAQPNGQPGQPDPWAPGPPPGPPPGPVSESFRQTCQVMYEDAFRIQAQCLNVAGAYQFNDFIRQGCVGDIANLNGVLSCERQPGFGPGPMPGPGPGRPGWGPGPRGPGWGPRGPRR